MRDGGSVFRFVMDMAECLVQEKPTLRTLRPDDHLPDAIVILSGDCEGVIDLFDLSGMCKQRCKPLGVCVEQFQSVLRIVV